MHQCCTEPYDLEFDMASAENDINDYKINGVRKNSKPLIHLLCALDLEGLSLLDIGGGVGSVVFELFNEGIESAIHVDISSAYVRTFRSEAAVRSLSKRIKSHLGDFIDLHEQIAQVDVVTLDKVICCYPNYEDLVRRSVQKATQWYAFVIPRDIWWVKLIHFIERRWRKFKGKTFETYIHPVSQIKNIIDEEGFHLHKQVIQGEWYYAIYRKQNSTRKTPIDLDSL